MTQAHWTQIVSQLHTQNKRYVTVTVLGVRGSAPRDSGTKMVVTAERCYHSIGGGQLEFMAIQQARKLLDDAAHEQHLEHYPLGPKLGQCCGGSTVVLFEKFQPLCAEVMLFGAGHVGQALCNILAELPVRLSWVDNRQEQFPEIINVDRIHTICSDTPVSQVATMPPDSYYLIMTHDHQLDFALCCELLKRDDARYIGLIGSKTKWARFERRLTQAGFSTEQINRIQCPVGLTAVPGKRPMEVAVSIAGALIAEYQKSATAKTNKQQGVQWKQLTSLEETTEACGGCNDCK